MATIKVDVDVVSILASVRDKRGALIPNLEKQDFTILEDGKPQPIKYFTKETDLPLTIGLLVDVSGSQRNLIDIERSAASQFFREVLRKKDVAFLISFGEETELLQDYTGSPRLLTEGLGQLRPSSGVQRHPSRSGADHRSAPRHGAVRRRVPGGERKAEERSGPQGDRADHRWRGPGQPPDAQPGDRGGAKVRRRDLQHRVFRSARLRRRFGMGGGGGDGELRKMSDETGGHVYKVDRKHTLEQVFKELQDEMRSQYAIGYTPTNDTKDGGLPPARSRLAEQGPEGAGAQRLLRHQTK